MIPSRCCAGSRGVSGWRRKCTFGTPTAVPSVKSGSGTRSARSLSVHLTTDCVLRLLSFLCIFLYICMWGIQPCLGTTVIRMSSASSPPAQVHFAPFAQLSDHWSLFSTSLPCTPCTHLLHIAATPCITTSLRIPSHSRSPGPSCIHRGTGPASPPPTCCLHSMHFHTCILAISSNVFRFPHAPWSYAPRNMCTWEALDCDGCFSDEIVVNILPFSLP